MNGMMDGICGRIAPGLCRLSMNGGIAVRTRAGYRSYDMENRRLVNCDGFAVDVGEDFFFVLPTNRVRAGDIILAGGAPRCVLSADGGTITAINYEDATVETLLPERHMLMGSTYLYGRIVSLFGRDGVRGKKGLGRMMKYMMLSGMIRGREDGFGRLLPLMMLGGNGGFLDDLLDGFEDEEEADDEKKEA